MADYLTTDTELTSVANAIRTKGGTSSSLVYPTGFVSAINAISTGTDVSDTTAVEADVRVGKYFHKADGSKVQGSIADQAAQTITPTTSDQTIASGKYLTGTQTIKGDANLVAANIAKDVTIFGVTGTHEGGGGGNPTAEENDVIFIDYDGTIRYSYSASDFANLTALPANPTHEGLTAQGWNWTLSDAKTYVANYGELIIGQMYVTTDGKTRLYIHVDYPYYPETNICFTQTVSNGVTIDWGDGQTQTISSTGRRYASHHYDSTGDYVITLNATSGTYYLGGGTSTYNVMGKNSSNLYNYYTQLMRIELGSNVTEIPDYMCYMCYSLKSITICKEISSIGALAFYYTGLSGIVIPNPGNNITFNNMNLTGAISLIYASLPNCISTLPNSCFSGCTVLRRASIPSSVTSIGNQAFYECRILNHIIIPNSVGAIGQKTFYYCYSIQNVQLSNALTNIPMHTFYGDYSMEYIVIPSQVTNIESSAIYGMSNNLKRLVMKPTTPPTLNGTISMYNYGKILVPYSSDHSILENYKTASNWSNYASKMEEEPQ